MFSEFAPLMREKGWSSPIPIRPRLKKPAIFRLAGLQQAAANRGRVRQVACGSTGITASVSLWPRQRHRRRPRLARSGKCGTSLGHHQGDPRRHTADPRRPAAEETGALPLRPDLVIRQALWRLRAVHPVGQCVCFGIHPDTGQPYRWMAETPATLGPAELPLVSSRQVHALIDALEDLDPEATAPRRAGSPSKAGAASRDPTRAAADEEAPAAAARLLAADAQRQTTRHDGRLGDGAGHARLLRPRDLHRARRRLQRLMSDELGMGGGRRRARQRHPLGARARRPRRRDGRRRHGAALASINAAWNAGGGA